jgi:hypothetical protein
MSDAISRMFNDQRLFNQLIWDKERYGTDEKAVIERLQHLTLGVVEEALEFLRTYESKVHRRSTKPRLQNAAHSHIELIDMFKYWLSLADAADFPMDRLEELYFAKSRVVQYRYQEEWQMRIDRPVVVVDIDNVLADYIVGLCMWLRAHITHLVPSVQAPEILERVNKLQHQHKWIGSETLGLERSEWARIKHLFRIGGGKRTLPVFPDAKPFLNWCHESGWLIILMTSRPVGEYPNLFSDTLAWLTDFDLPFDFVWWATEKGERLDESHVSLRSRIVFAVDDDERFVRQFRSKGIRAYHLNRTQLIGEEQFTVANLYDLMSREEDRKLEGDENGTD